MTARAQLLQVSLAGALMVGCGSDPVRSGAGQDLLQSGNEHAKVPLITKGSRELQDNRIGGDFGYLSDGVSDGVYDHVFTLGTKWVRTAFDGRGSYLNWQRVEGEPGTYSVNPLEDAAITTYVNNGVNVLVNLGVGPGDGIEGTRFATEDEIQRYLSYVRFMLEHFKGRVRYYELWNEPDGTDPGTGLPSRIAMDVDTYARVISRAAPIMREVDPEAKILIGSVGGEWILGFPGYGEYTRSIVHMDYLRRLITSGVAPLVDGISWHPFYGNKPDDPYYRTYPEFVREIKDLAASQGFQGEYFANEIGYYTAPSPDPSGHTPPFVTVKAAAKYYARAIVMHLGLGFTVTTAPTGGLVPRVVSSLCTVMAAATPLSLPMQVQSGATNIETYAFALPGGSRLVAIWTDGEAVDDDPGVSATLTFPGLSVQRVIGVDILNAFEQELITTTKNGGLVVGDLLVKDYPIILRLVP